MKISLWRRQYGIHEKVKETTIEGDFNDYYKGEDDINEDLLMQNIPEKFLPKKPERILISVQSVNSSGEVTGGTGQRRLKVFKNWAKYFDSYVLELERG